jgi:integrase
MDVADARVTAAAAAVAARPHRRRLHLALFRAEQDALMVRLAADAALVRGELVALRTDDLHDRNISVARSSHDGVIRPLTNHRRATLTVGSHTAECWAAHVGRWREVRGHGPWLFAATPDRVAPLTPSGLGQRFARLARLAQLSDASLHRLRHTVGTYLVAEGKIVQASKRLRHRDVSTTYREYRHAVPIDDHGVADRLAQLYGFDDG